MSEVFAKVTDEELQRAALHGDSRAEEALIGRYQRVVRACARPLFLTGGDSEDLLQEGILGLLGAIRRYDPDQGGGFSAYAQVCIRNRLRSAVRSALREKHSPLNSSVSWDYVDWEQQAEEPPKSPEEMFIAREQQAEDMARLRGKLSAMEREILGYYLDGLSYDEIARKTHRSTKSVDNAVQRIRRKLARHFDR